MLHFGIIVDRCRLAADDIPEAVVTGQSVMQHLLQSLILTLGRDSTLLQSTTATHVLSAEVVAGR